MLASATTAVAAAAVGSDRGVGDVLVGPTGAAALVASSPPSDADGATVVAGTDAGVPARDALASAWSFCDKVCGAAVVAMALSGSSCMVGSSGFFLLAKAELIWSKRDTTGDGDGAALKVSGLAAGASCALEVDGVRPENAPNKDDVEPEPARAIAALVLSG